MTNHAKLAAIAAAVAVDGLVRIRTYKHRRKSAKAITELGNLAHNLVNENVELRASVDLLVRQNNYLIDLIARNDIEYTEFDEIAISELFQ